MDTPRKLAPDQSKERERLEYVPGHRGKDSGLMVAFFLLLLALLVWLLSSGSAHANHAAGVVGRQHARQLVRASWMRCSWESRSSSSRSPSSTWWLANT